MKYRRSVLLFIHLFGVISIWGSNDLNNVRQVVQEWVQLEKTRSLEASLWVEKKENLQDLIAASRSQVGSLKQEIASMENQSSEANEIRRSLLKKQQWFEENSKIIKVFVSKMEEELRNLKIHLPKPLEDKLSNFYLRLPSRSDPSSMGIAERMQTVIGILSMVQKFNNQITVTNEIKKLNNGTQGEVKTLYLGLGSAYYVSTSGEESGYGYPSKLGWVWKSKDSLASEISESIKIAENLQQEARFISLPVNIQE